MNGYEKLKKLYDEIDNLIKQRVTSDTPSFITWRTKTERTLNSIYGNGKELEDFLQTNFSVIIFTDDENDYVNACKYGLEETKAVLQAYLDELEEEEHTQPNINRTKTFSHKEKAFIVHGHNAELKQEVARMLEKQNITAIILSEQVNGGTTIIEKIEKYSDIDVAICLFTADDIGRGEKEQENNKRARQNVVFETGYFMGKLGRQNIIILADSGIEIPSDLSGIVYTDNAHWQIEVLKELRSMGFDIDMNKAF